MPATQPCFDHEVEADLVERASSYGIVEATQRDRRFIVATAAGFIEQSLGNGGGEAAVPPIWR